MTAHYVGKIVGNRQSYFDGIDENWYNLFGEVLGNI